MTHDQIIREEFEAWCVLRGCAAIHLQRSVETPDNYALAEMQEDWKTWQAAWSVATGHSA